MIIDQSKVNILEKDIEEYLWQHPSQCGVDYWLKRQFAVPSGIIDLIGVTEDDDLVVVEVKNTPIDANALAQVSRYAYDIWMIRQMFVNQKADKPRVYRMVVGKSIDTRTMLEAEALSIQVSTFAVELRLDISPQSWAEHYMQERCRKWSDLRQDEDLIAFFEDYRAGLEAAYFTEKEALEEQVNGAQND